MKNIIGKKIAKFRDMTKEELKMLGWVKYPFKLYKVIELEDGTCIFPSRDEEGNDIGSFIAVEPN